MEITPCFTIFWAIGIPLSVSKFRKIYTVFRVRGKVMSLGLAWSATFLSFSGHFDPNRLLPQFLETPFSHLGKKFFSKGPFGFRWFLFVFSLSLSRTKSGILCNSSPFTGWALYCLDGFNLTWILYNNVLRIHQQATPLK